MQQLRLLTTTHSCLLSWQRDMLFSWKDLSLEIELKGKKCCYISALRVKAAWFILTFCGGEGGGCGSGGCPAAEYFICREKLSNVAVTGTELNRYLKHVSLAS